MNIEFTLKCSGFTDVRSCSVCLLSELTVPLKKTSRCTHVFIIYMPCK